MNTWVIIALIVCGTFIVGLVIWAIVAAIAARSVRKTFKHFDDNFKF